MLAGGLVTVPIFFALIPDPSLLGTTRWPAGAAIVWKGVAMLVAHGFGALHPTAQVGLVVGAVLGILLPVLEIAFPAYKPYIPSATGVGLAFTIPGLYCISMFLGGLFAMCFRKMRPILAEEYTIPVASGLIAGETLMGALVALLSVKGWLG